MRPVKIKVFKKRTLNQRSNIIHHRVYQVIKTLSLVDIGDDINLNIKNENKAKSIHAFCMLCDRKFTEKLTKKCRLNVLYAKLWDTWVVLGLKKSVTFVIFTNNAFL